LSSWHAEEPDADGVEACHPDDGVFLRHEKGVGCQEIRKVAPIACVRSGYVRGESDRLDVRVFIVCHESSRTKQKPPETGITKSPGSLVKLIYMMN
jgi:hypothetical protein